MPKKILVVDDSAVNRLFLCNMLREEYNILEATNGKEALDVIHQAHGALSAVLLDIVMPVMDGYEVLRRMRDDVGLSHIPVIMVTASGDEASRTKALSLGANDFILKPYNPDIVRHCVKNNIALYETATTLSAIQKDKLTGLYNREAFFEKVSEMVAGHAPGYYILSCFDIDNFKLINDQFGAVEGDRILREIGRTVREDMETVGGIAGRISGDNFAALLPLINREFTITRIIQQDRMAFSNKQAVVFSIGRYIVTDLSLSASAIYDRAYIAKQSVKGRYDEHIAYFDDAMLEKLVRNQKIVADVDRAIKEHQFEVWFQPQRNHLTGALVGAEALVRWRHPEKGLIPPGDFIPLFEQNGFIYELDQYVWDKTCRYLRRWMDEGRNPVPVSVNISRRDIFRPGFVDVLTELVEKYALPVDLLRLEITESAFAQSTKRIVDIVNQLIEKGFIVEIDDFGNGYSSLNTLKSVPAQVVKLDMRFLEDDNDGERGGNILSSIVRMTKWLGLSVIAEGVEDQAQGDYLASIGCSYIQGYLYARPMPASDYEEYCRDAKKEQRLLTMRTVENLDNNAFWDPRSMDTLIFNSYVGAACIFEYANRKIELLRVNRKFTAILGDGTISVEDTLKLDWISCLSPESLVLVRGVLERSRETRDEYTNEYVFFNIPGAPNKTYLRATMRVIAISGERLLVYCTCENITAQREAELRERLAADQIQAIMRDIGSGVTAAVLNERGEVALLFTNEKFFTLHGFTREQYQAEVTDNYDLVHPDDRERVYRESMEAYAAETPIQMEYRIIRRDGAVRWLRVDLSSTRFTGIEQNVHLCIFNDITAEKRSARKILDTDEQLRFLNSMSHELLAQPDTDLGIHAALNKLMEYFSGNRAYIFEFDMEKGLASNTYEAYGEGVSAEMDNLQNVPLSLLDFWLAAFALHGCYAIEDIAALDDSRSDEKARLLAQNISSLFVIPLKRGGQLIGMMGVDDPRRPLRHVDRLVALGDYIAVMLTRRDLDRRISKDNLELATMMGDMPGGFVRMRIGSGGSLIPFYFNEGFSRLTGMSRDELRELFLEDIYNGIHPEDHALVKEAVVKMLETGRASSSRYRIRHKTDHFIWVTTFGRITKDASGDAVLNAYFLDATDQVKEDKIEKSLLDNLPCGAGIYAFQDGRMRLIYQNNSYWELVGLNEAKFPDTAPMSAIHPDDVPIIMRELSSALEQGRDVVCDIRLRHLTQGYFPVRLVGRIVPREEGGILIYATFTPDRRDALS